MSNEKNSIDDLVKAILHHGPTVIEYGQISGDLSDYTNRVLEERLDYPVPKEVNIDDWFIPASYKKMDIEKFLMDQCPIENHNRLTQELDLFHKNKMTSVLQAMKYIVDTLRKNNIVWGVGRGSSVASYALFLIGIHKIDSVKYNLPLEEFFKGGENG